MLLLGRWKAKMKSSQKNSVIFRARLWGFVIWGVAHGLVAYFSYNNTSTSSRGNWVFLISSMAVSGFVSALIFSLLLTFKLPNWLGCIGFPVTSALFPFIMVIGGNSLYYGKFYIGSPLNILGALVWAMGLFPIALVSAIVFILIQLSKDRVKPT
jgi:hypothetical protein